MSKSFNESATVTSAEADGDERLWSQMQMETEMEKALTEHCTTTTQKPELRNLEPGKHEGGKQMSQQQVKTKD